MGFLDKVKGKLLNSPDSKLSEANEAISLNPLDYRAWYTKAVSLHRLGNYEEALEAYEEAIRYIDLFKLKHRDMGDLSSKKGLSIRAQGDIFSNQGNQLVAQEKYEEAIKCFDEAIGLNPKKSVYWMYKSGPLKSLGLKAKAKEAEEMAHKLTALDMGLSPEEE